MKSLGTATTDGAFGEGPLRLEVLLIYEDLRTALRAKQTFEHVVRQVGLEADIHVNAWRFDLLRDPQMREEAAREAGAATLVLLSAHGRGELPAEVSSWFKQWLATKGDEPCALVVSLDSNARASVATANPMLSSLQTAAAPAGVEVFPHFGEASQAEWELSTRRIHGRTEIKSRLDLHRVEPHAHWGLNE